MDDMQWARCVSGGIVMRSFVLLLFASLMTAGCATTPSFDKLSGVTPKTIVDVIECEIIAAKKKNAIKVARDLSHQNGPIAENLSNPGPEEVCGGRGAHASGGCASNADSVLHADRHHFKD